MKWLSLLGLLACRPAPVVAPAFVAPIAIDPISVRDVVRDVFVTKSNLAPTIAVQVADALVEEAQSRGLDPLLIVAMIEVESQWKEAARSRAGALGYMQLMPKTKAWVLSRESDLGNLVGSEQDVRVAVRYFALLNDAFKRTERALQAYNCGPACVVNASKRNLSLPKETQQYPKKVLTLRQRYQKLVNEALLAAN